MFFAEFISSSRYPKRGARLYFVSRSPRALLTMTDGKGFGQFKFSSGREITEEQARAVGLPYLKAGIKAVRDENAKIVYLGHKT